MGHPVNLGPEGEPVDPDAPLDDTDGAILAGLADLYTRLDPVPAGLADRVLFALELDDLEMELARLDVAAEPVGVRGEEQARTITFASQNLTVMVTSTLTQPGRFRLDGWAAPGGGLPVELRITGSSLRATADDDGRFEFIDVPTGRFQLVFHPAPGSEAALRVPVVTPAVEL